MQVRVAILGLDRISVSMALALKRYQAQPKSRHSFTIIGSDLRGQVMKNAEKLGALDNFDRKTGKAVENADVVIVNVPPGQLEDVYLRLGPELKRGAVVLDMATFKQASIARAQASFPKLESGQPAAYLVGITPIVAARGLYVGSWDAEAATADLFDGCEVLIIPDTKCPSEAIALAEDIVQIVGGTPRFMDPAEHDGLAAATEGLPALLGAALFATLQRSDGWPELRRMINPAFALAIQNLRHQNPQDLLALLTQNRVDLLRHVEGLLLGLQEARDVLKEAPDADGDYVKLQTYLQRIGQEWEKWDTKRHSGKWDDAPRVETAMPGLFGGLGDMMSLRRRPKREDDEE